MEDLEGSKDNKGVMTHYYQGRSGDKTLMWCGFTAHRLNPLHRAVRKTCGISTCVNPCPKCVELSTLIELDNFEP